MFSKLFSFKKNKLTPKQCLLCEEILHQLKEYKQDRNDKFITSTSDNREKIFKISFDIFKETIEDVEKADNKIQKYFILINFIAFLYVNFYGKLFVNLIQNNVIKINFIDLLIIILGITSFIFIIVIFFKSLQSLKQITLKSHPTWKHFNEMLKEKETKFWHQLYSHYFINAYENNKKIEAKRKKIKQIETFLLILFIISLISFILFVMNKLDKINSIIRT